MKRKIAIPMADGMLCAHFGHCQTFAIVETEDDRVIDFKEEVPPEHIPGLYPRWVAEFGVTDVIAGGMGQQAIMLFNEQNINAFVGAPIKSATELVEDFLKNRLQLNANYCNHDEHDHGGQCKH
ncbi:MAG: ATPase [Candidatus Moranbacteria bacterium]|nr:ATPase [Candidatus Moranbacteria bacterium]